MPALVKRYVGSLFRTFEPKLLKTWVCEFVTWILLIRLPSCGLWPGIFWIWEYFSYLELLLITLSTFYLNSAQTINFDGSRTMTSGSHVIKRHNDKTENIFFRSLRQGSQMVYFRTKNPDLGKFWRALEWDRLAYSMAVWNILQPLGIFYGHLVILWQFGIFYGHLVYFMAICVFFPVFVYCKIWQPCSASTRGTTQIFAFFDRLSELWSTAAFESSKRGWSKKSAHVMVVDISKH
jgi:hypothetical protein